MKHMTLALGLFAMLGLAACSNTSAGTWTPMSEGRTAGDGTVKMVKKSHKADRAFSHAMHK